MTVPRERVMCLYWGEDVFESVICLNNALFGVVIKEVG